VVTNPSLLAAGRSYERSVDPGIAGPWLTQLCGSHAGAMDRNQLADFLRRRRTSVQPADVGLTGGPRRRTPGLRREEVAALAGMSTDYYVRLEQARGPHPSAQLLAALARALRLSDDERDHLFYLAGQQPPMPHGPTGHVGPALLHMLDRMNDIPATVLSDTGEVLVQNPLSVALLGNLSGSQARDRNFNWRWFTDPGLPARYPVEDHEHHSRAHVADLRATAGRRQHDPDVVDLVRALRSASPEFDRLWQEHVVAVRRSDTKRLVHPEVGVVHVDCETLLTPAQDQKLMIFTPRPGTGAAEQLRLLAVIGAERLGVDQVTTS
jgi:transcriptional regulator with XRE-family HTH domain